MIPEIDLFVVKYGHKVRECPIIMARGREGKKFSPSIPVDDVPRKNGIYVVRAKGSKKNNEDDVGT